MCIACRQAFDKSQLLRVVRTPEGAVAVDETGKKNGRGAYVCSAEACVGKCEKGLLKKHLGCEIPPEIYEEIRAKRCAKR
ncbi:MAG: YlxR family protein [Clostridiales bacterium]|nr:YlxR family protein [Clostridiales bacterium]